MLLCFVQVSLAQVEPSNSASTSKTASEIFQELQQKSGYTFFYLEEWMDGLALPENIPNASLSEILDTLLSDTSLNYYILEEEKRVFLLQNTIIYDELPISFYQQSDTILQSQTAETRGNLPPPTFFQDEVVQRQQQLPVARVGRADERDLRSSYRLSGRVLNAENGAPIPDLAIRSGGRVAVTDERGAYELELPAGYNLVSTSAMGIQDSEREVIMYNDGTLDFVLQES